MRYPEDFTAEDIMEFEYEYSLYLDLEDPYSLESINRELQVLADEQREQKLVDRYPV
jgi:hypothetical protein